MCEMLNDVLRKRLQDWQSIVYDQGFIFERRKNIKGMDHELFILYSFLYLFLDNIQYELFLLFLSLIITDISFPGSSQFWGYIGGLLFCFFGSMSNRPPGLARASQKSAYTAKFRKNCKEIYWEASFSFSILAVQTSNIFPTYPH